MRALCTTVLIATGLLAAQPAHATFSCTGPITYLAMNTSGSVCVAVGQYGVWSICSVSSTPFGGVPPEACRAWYAGLLAAQKSGHGVRFYFNTGSCETIGSWVTATPNMYHMDLLDS